VGGVGWQEKVYNREEWTKLLRAARGRILHIPMEWNECMMSEVTLNKLHGVTFRKIVNFIQYSHIIVFIFILKIIVNIFKVVIYFKTKLIIIIII
jgi:hypothetical protein